jgi:hypothetical protein
MGIVEKIRDCKNKTDIVKAINLQNETAFYVERNENPHSVNFYNRIAEVYNKDMYKLRRFRNAFMGNTLPSVDVCDTIFNELSRVFESQNKYINYSFSFDELKLDAENYFDKYNQFYTGDLWQAFKTKYCSFVVVDLPRIQGTPKPEPYPYILNINNVKSIELDGTEPKEIIFTEKLPDGEILFYLYDTERYSVYTVKETEQLIFEARHDLGYCPVKFIRNSFLNSQSKILRATNVTSSLDDLFWYVFKSIESYKADLLYLNPDKQTPKSSCGWEDKNGKCYGGKLIGTGKEKHPILAEDGISQRLCPNCGEKQYNSGGAGNLIMIDYESSAVTEGKVDPTRALSQYITPPIDGVNTQYDRITKLKENIIKSCVGSDSPQTKEAVNELQQLAGFESRETILKKLSVDLSQTIKWIEGTACKLRYGKSFISNSYYMGDKWYLQTVDDLINRKEKTTNPIEKDEIEMQIIETKYKNNPEKLEREKLLYKLVPYRTLTDKEFIDLAKTDAVEGKELRMNFTNLINLFELDYGDISTFYNRFSDNVAGTKRISIINDILNSFIKEPIKITEDVQN